MTWFLNLVVSLLSFPNKSKIWFMGNVPQSKMFLEVSASAQEASANQMTGVTFTHELAQW